MILILLLFNEKNFLKKEKEKLNKMKYIKIKKNLMLIYQKKKFLIK